MTTDIQSAERALISPLPAAWGDADVASIEEVVAIQKNKTPEDVAKLDAFLLTGIAEIESTWGPRYIYTILTESGEEWVFTLGGKPKNPDQKIGKLVIERMQLYERFCENPRNYVAALESISTKQGNEGYQFTTPIQKKRNAEARAGGRYSSYTDQSDLRERIIPHRQPQAPVFVPDYEETPEHKK